MPQQTSDPGAKKKSCSSSNGHLRQKQNKREAMISHSGRVKISNFTAAGKQACYDDGSFLWLLYPFMTTAWRLFNYFVL